MDGEPAAQIAEHAEALDRFASGPHPDLLQAVYRHRRLQYRRSPRGSQLPETKLTGPKTKRRAARAQSGSNVLSEEALVAREERGGF